MKVASIVASVSYADNQQRAKYKTKFADYDEFLESLEMKAEIGPFSPTYLDRISQLTNKTNQYRLSPESLYHVSTR